MGGNPWDRVFASEGNGFVTLIISILIAMLFIFIASGVFGAVNYFQCGNWEACEPVLQAIKGE